MKFATRLMIKESLCSKLLLVTYQKEFRAEQNMLCYVMSCYVTYIRISQGWAAQSEQFTTGLLTLFHVAWWIFSADNLFSHSLCIQVAFWRNYLSALCDVWSAIRSMQLDQSDSSLLSVLPQSVLSQSWWVATSCHATEWKPRQPEDPHKKWLW